ncbi:MAG TPA: mechanosensitive ion channel [Leptospiraceae bacterium]|nr:mechanosensitive ion channel [Leptospiraceae bacterium]HMY65297.1 mechanosensitive ion channel [Leptospiraceae bacterium]HNF14176.1 mechanosensitive ion channel [Leptospiraceae bacterium]HNF24222.1 mechanosensitive ion channel [Leptospiraceae bacterium]HNI98168.1 mechanosensitive ion channel [Leptospiraceae bacterium]
MNLEKFSFFYILGKQKREFSDDFIIYLYVLLLLTLLYNLILKVFEFYDKKSDTAAIYKRRKTARYVFFVFALLATIPLFYSRIAYLPTILGFTGAGIILSMKDVTLNFIGWFFIHSNSGFTVGDRIEIQGTKGDVVNIGMMRFTLVELSHDENNEQSTNRLVHIPNHKVISEKILISRSEMDYVWDELKISITVDSDWEKAETVCNSILYEVFTQHVNHEELQEKVRKLSEHYLLKIGKTSPITYTVIEEHVIRLSLRYLVRVHEKRNMRSDLSKKVLKQFKKFPKIRIYVPD